MLCISGLFWIHRKLTRLLPLTVMAECRKYHCNDWFWNILPRNVTDPPDVTLNVYIHYHIYKIFWYIFSIFLSCTKNDVQLYSSLFPISLACYLIFLRQLCISFVLFCLSVLFWLKLFPSPSRNWLSIQGWTMPSWLVGMWHPWGAMESLPCTRCLTGPVPAGEGMAL